MGNDSDFWPRAGDTLFLSGSGDMAAMLDGSWDRAHAYICGYKEAGDILVEHVRANGSPPDTLVFPIGFNYRQCLELHLKLSIGLCQRYLGATMNIPKEHKLHALWNELKPLLSRISDEWCEDVDIDAEHAIDACMAEFAKHDSTSQGFRYWRDAKGGETLSTLHSIDLDNLQHIVTKIDGFLSGIVDWLDDREHVKNDYEADMASLMPKESDFISLSDFV